MSKDDDGYNEAALDASYEAALAMSGNAERSPFRGDHNFDAGLEMRRGELISGLGIDPECIDVEADDEDDSNLQIAV